VLDTDDGTQITNASTTTAALISTTELTRFFVSIDNANNSLICFINNTEVYNGAFSGASDVAVNFGADALGLFCSYNATAPFSGKTSGIAMRAGPIVDITDQAMRDALIPASGPLFASINDWDIKFSGDAAAYAAGTNEGAGGDYTVGGGTPTDA